jgi:hypothetical protein
MYKILKIVHHTAGLIGSLLVFFMALTGIFLNHRSLIGYSSNAALKLQEFIFALHSGNVGNLSIVWLTDLGAICMIVLSISGVWMWVNVSVRRKRRGKHE